MGKVMLERTSPVGPCGKTFCTVLTLAAGLATGVMPDGVQAQEFAAQLNGSFLRRIIEESVNEGMANRPSSLRWRGVENKVEVSGSGNVVHVHLNMSTSITDPVPDPEVMVDFDMDFSCNYYAEAPPQKALIGLGISPFQVEVNYPWYVDLASGGVSLALEQIGNEVADTQADASNAMRDKAMMELNAQLGAVELPYCPSITASSEADVRFTFDHGEECTDGDATELRPCPANYTGPGRHEVCVGGYWELRDSCDRITPPGHEDP